MSGDSVKKILAIVAILAVLGVFYYFWYLGGSMPSLGGGAYGKPIYQPPTPLSPMERPEPEKPGQDWGWLWWLLLIPLILALLYALRRILARRPAAIPPYGTYGVYGIYGSGGGGQPITTPPRRIPRLPTLRLGRHIILFPILLRLGQPNTQGAYTTWKGSAITIIPALKVDGEKTKGEVAIGGKIKRTNVETEYDVKKEGEQNIEISLKKIEGKPTCFPVSTQVKIVANPPITQDKYVTTTTIDNSIYQTDHPNPQYLTCAEETTLAGEIIKIHKNKYLQVNGHVKISGITNADLETKKGEIDQTIKLNNGENKITVTYTFKDESGNQLNETHQLNVIREQEHNPELWIFDGNSFFAPLEKDEWMKLVDEKPAESPLKKLEFPAGKIIKACVAIRDKDGNTPQTIHGTPFAELKFFAIREPAKKGLAKTEIRMKYEPKLKVFWCDVPVPIGGMNISAYAATNFGTYATTTASIKGNKNIETGLPSDGFAAMNDYSFEEITSKLNPPHIKNESSPTSGRFTIHLMAYEYPPLLAVAGVCTFLETLTLDLIKKNFKAVMIVPLDKPQSKEEWDKIFGVYKPKYSVRSVAKTKRYGDIEYLALFGEWKGVIICMIVAEYTNTPVYTKDPIKDIAARIYDRVGMDLTRYNIKDAVLSKALDFLYSEKHLEPPAIFHQNSHLAMLSLLVAANKYKVPSVFTLHGPDITPVDEKILEELDGAGENEAAKDQRCRKNGRLIRELVCMKTAKVVAVPSENYLKTEFTEKFGEFLNKPVFAYNSSKRIFLGYSIDHQRAKKDFLPKLLQNNGNTADIGPRTPVLFLPAGRIEARKGYGFVARNIPKILEKHGDTVFLIRTKLSKEGGIDGKIIDSFRNLRQNHPKNVIILEKKLTDEEYTALYAASDFVVVPSLFGETFGLVAVESLVQGTPVIMTDAGGLKDIANSATPYTHVVEGFTSRDLISFFSKNEWYNQEDTYDKHLDRLSPLLVETINNAIDSYKKGTQKRLERSDKPFADFVKKFGTPAKQYFDPYRMALSEKSQKDSLERTIDSNY